MRFLEMTLTLFVLTAQFMGCVSDSTPNDAPKTVVYKPIAVFPVIDVESQAIADGADFDELRRRVDSGKFSLDDISGLCAFRTRQTEILPLLIRQLTTATPPPQWGQGQAPSDYAVALIDYLDPPHALLLAALQPELAKSPDIRLRQAVELLGTEGIPLLPRLLRDLSAGGSRANGVQAAIAAMGAAAIDPVLASMDESPADERLRYLEILRLMGPIASPARNKLLELTAESDTQVASQAMWALLVIAPDRSDVTTRLMAMLPDPKYADSVNGIPLACRVLARDGSQESLAQMLQYYLAGPDLPLSRTITVSQLRDAGKIGKNAVLSSLNRPTISDDELLRLSLIAMKLEIDEAAPLLLSQLRRLLKLPPPLDPATKRPVEGRHQRDERLVTRVMACVARLNGDLKELILFVSPNGARINNAAVNIAPRLASGTVSDADIDTAIGFLKASSQLKTSSERQDGYRACEFLGPRGRKVIEEMAQQATKPPEESSGYVTPYGVLTNIGEPAVPALLKLREKGGRQEVLALGALSNMGSEAHSALEGSDQWLRNPVENVRDTDREQVRKRVISMILEDESIRFGSVGNEPRWRSADELAQLTTITDLSQRDSLLWAYRGKWATTRPPRLTDSEKESLRKLVVAKSALAAAMLALCGETVPELSQLLEADWKLPSESRTLRFLADTTLWYDGEDRNRLLEIVRSVPDGASPQPNEPGFWLRLEAKPDLAKNPQIASFLDNLDPDQIGHPITLTRVDPGSPLIRSIWKKVPFACGRLRIASRQHVKTRFIGLLSQPVNYWCYRQVPCKEWNVSDLFQTVSWFDVENIRKEILSLALQLIDFSRLDCDKQPDTLPLWSSLLEGEGEIEACQSLWTVRPNAESASLIAEKLRLTHRGLFDIRDNSKAWAMFDDLSSELKPRLEELRRESKEYPSAAVRFRLRRLVRNIESAP